MVNKKKDLFISIIVPVYKVEKYLEKCIQSILNQTYKEFELLLVDDGSPDRCPELCDFYAAQYDNVIALHKSNGGLSDARNYGLKYAKGNFITFVDSDDYISPDYLETLVALKTSYDADICVGGICVFYEEEIALSSRRVVEKTF